MIDIKDLKFLQVLRSSSTLVSAARELRLSPSAVTQRLQQIEKQLDVHLVDRSARRLCFTEEGELLCRRSSDLLEQYDELIMEMQRQRNDFVGKLKINAPFGFGRRYLAAITAQFQKLYPEVEIVLMLSEQPMIEMQESFDVIIHIGELPISNLIAHSIAPNCRFVCASADFLEKHGNVSSPEELAHLPCIALAENNEDTTLWQFKKEDANCSVRVNATLSSNDGSVIRQWAIQGQGIMMRSEWDVADDFRNGSLVRLLHDWHLPDAPVMAITNQRKGVPERTRKFITFLKESFLPLPPWRLNA